MKSFSVKELQSVCTIVFAFLKFDWRKFSQLGFVISEEFFHVSIGELIKSSGDIVGGTKLFLDFG
jgi:hypothetical protein